VLVIHGRAGGYDQGLMMARILNDPQFHSKPMPNPFSPQTSQY
jgi:hypothetical protein